MHIFFCCFAAVASSELARNYPIRPISAILSSRAWIAGTEFANAAPAPALGHARAK
jgi:hypothetical protein